MPSVVPRAVFGSLGYVLAGYIALDMLWPSAAWPGAAVVGLLAFLSLVGFAYVGYSRRRYTLTDEGIVESKWAFWTRQRSLHYDDIEDITMTRSWLQSQYGVGTIRINHTETDIEADEKMTIRYVETPGTVFSDIRSAVAAGDPSVRVDSEETDIEASWDRTVGSLTNRGLAAETSSAYHVPVTILKPRPASAFLFGARRGAIAGVVLGLFGLLWSSLLLLGPIAVADIPVELVVAGLLGLVGLCAILAGLWRAWRHNGTQYELYQDHMRIIEGATTQTIQYDELYGIDVTRFPLGLLDTARVRLTNDEPRTLVELAHVPDPAAFEALLEELVEANI